MKLAIIGSRDCKQLTVDDVIKRIPKNCTQIISGGASGVDMLAKSAAEQLDIPIEEIIPNYALFGKSAPILRNHTIVDIADEVLAFWDYQSKGTRSALLECLKQNKPLKIFIIDDENSHGYLLKKDFAEFDEK